MTAYQKLIKHFARGRTVCNCGEAYDTHCPGSESDPAERTCAGCANTPNGHTFCQHGCSSNQLNARDEIAETMLKAIDLVKL